ncbi:MAG: FKBP-type peptidyl-prolyl cis-trans isomerase [Gammaproteobacteria bacterium]|nr:FKBP-type peptidyl-prolyl cis-trans isomerase [Gammaproteobacteria bacterium]MBU1655103.1 FKBP-type peptidyl-prolyl cis-trans isomerase [Gammaproteobacteria bacterium]MBU1961575.1 FKBP-type peptidyl-prolyl cis-trans isomerase [Gammaproteobacteria bacterium]
MSLENPVEIVPGSRVILHFALSLSDGTEVVSTFSDEPLTCTLGDGTLRPGMELALYGLKSGDTQSLTLEPEQAYGLHDSSLIHQVERGLFPDSLLPAEGQIISFSLPNGQETLGAVLELEENSLTIDFNHPLAGRQVVFRVEILEVAPAATQ